jgi:hypothetical protein
MTTAASPAPGPDAAEVIDLGGGRIVCGFVDEGYGQVMDAFIANAVERGDLGAACAVYRGGRAVVDIWGDIADARTGRAWNRDTAAVMFSCSNGVLAVCDVGFAYLGNQMGGYGDARARELTLALGRIVGS